MKLNTAAKVIQCHPRTVLRAIYVDPNPYWAPGYNPDFDMEEVAGYFDVKLSIFRRCAEGRDTFLKPLEASTELKVIPRTFRYRHYEPTIRVGRIVRYSRLDIRKQQGIRFKNELLAIL